jgi:hypothetical protein
MAAKKAAFKSDSKAPGKAAAGPPKEYIDLKDEDKDYVLTVGKADSQHATFYTKVLDRGTGGTVVMEKDGKPRTKDFFHKVFCKVKTKGSRDPKTGVIKPYDPNTYNGEVSGSMGLVCSYPEGEDKEGQDMKTFFAEYCEAIKSYAKLAEQSVKDHGFTVTVKDPFKGTEITGPANVTTYYNEAQHWMTFDVKVQKYEADQVTPLKDKLSGTVDIEATLDTLDGHTINLTGLSRLEFWNQLKDKNIYACISYSIKGWLASKGNPPGIKLHNEIVSATFMERERSGHKVDAVKKKKETDDMAAMYRRPIKIADPAEGGPATKDSSKDSTKESTKDLTRDLPKAVDGKTVEIPDDKNFDGVGDVSDVE